MSEVQYACVFVNKEVSVDSYEHGCDLKRRCILHEAVNICADTLPDLLKELGERYGMEIDDLWAPEECPGRFSFNRLENDDGDEPSPRERADFEAGRRNLWLADYDFEFEKRIVEPVTVAELDAAGIQHHD